MTLRHILAGSALLLCTGLAASDVEEKRNPVSADSAWSISEPSCMIDEGWDGGGGITVMPHEDHFDLGIYDGGLKKVATGKTVTLMLGANDIEADSRPMEANGVKSYEAFGYVLAVDQPWLENFVKSQVLRLSRNGRTLVRADLPGLAEALRSMMQCQAANAAADATMAAENAADAAEAAADAAADAAMNAADVAPK